MTSILDGVFDQKSQSEMSGVLLATAYDQIRSKWNGEPTNAKGNWGLRFAPLPKDKSKQKQGHSDKTEVPLERAFARAFEGKKTLWNQMSVASGLIDPYKDKRMAVDLVYKPNILIEAYEFLELKILNSNDTPLSAAFEVVGYGLMYLFSRCYAEKLGYDRKKNPVLRASRIGLRVLAEEGYYNSHDHRDFPVEKWNNVLKKYLKENLEHFGDVEMDFQFETFPSNFKCPEIVDKDLDEKTNEYLRNAIRNKVVR